MILVTGAAGTVGSRLVAGLGELGHRVRALVLPGDPLASRLTGTGCDVVEGDVTRPTTLRGCCAGVETIYHLAAVILARDPRVYEAVNVGGTRHLLAEAAGGPPPHFIYISSASVIYPRSTPYSRSKRECERLITAYPGLRYTIVRPTLVYEAGGGEELMRYWDALTRFPVAPLVGNGEARKRPVHVDDLMAGLLALVGSERAHGKTYNLSGGEVVTMRELSRLMLRHRGLRRPLVSLPVPLCRVAAAALRRLMRDPPLTQSAIEGVTQDADLDPADACTDLGYRPRGVREGFAQCFPVHT